MPTTPHRPLAPTDPERNGDEVPKSTGSRGSMGLTGQWGLIGNATAMLILIVFLFKVDARNEKKDEKVFELVDKANTTNDRNAAASAADRAILESHIATNIVEQRNHTQALDRVTTAVDKNTQMLTWAMTGLPWPFGPKQKDKSP